MKLINNKSILVPITRDSQPPKEHFPKIGSFRVSSRDATRSYCRPLVSISRFTDGGCSSGLSRGWPL